MGLVLGDLGGDRRQLDDLKAFGRRVVRPGLARQRPGAAGAAVGNEVPEAGDAFGRQQLFEVRRVAGLTAATTL